MSASQTRIHSGFNVKLRRWKVQSLFLETSSSSECEARVSWNKQLQTIKCNCCFAFRETKQWNEGRWKGWRKTSVNRKPICNHFITVTELFLVITQITARAVSLTGWSHLRTPASVQTRSNTEHHSEDGEEEIKLNWNKLTNK